MSLRSLPPHAGDNTAVPSFISKTYDIFNSEPIDDCCGWGVDGRTIVIKKIDVFAANVLPKFFKHSNFQSFVRQLHIYDFHKTSTLDPNHVGYANDFFRQDRPELLSQIRRKANPHPNRPHAVAKAIEQSKAVVSSSSSAEASAFAHPAAVKKANPVVTAAVNTSRPTYEPTPAASVIDHESQLLDMRLENKRLRDIIAQMKTNQKGMSNKFDRILLALQRAFSQGTTTAPFPNTFDMQNFQRTMQESSDSSRKLYSAIEQDCRDFSYLSSIEFELDVMSDDALGALLSSPRRMGGGQLAYTSSFDAFASHVTAPYPPPVPRYPETETIGGEALTKQSSFELFTTYVSMYGQPVDTARSGSKRPPDLPTGNEPKKRSPFRPGASTSSTAVDDSFGDMSSPQENFSFEPNSASRFNSLDFGNAARFNSLDMALGAGSDVPLSRLDSINSVDLNGLLNNLSRMESMDSDKKIG